MSSNAATNKASVVALSLNVVSNASSGASSAKGANAKGAKQQTMLI